MIEMEEERLRMREHVMNEVSQLLSDPLISCLDFVNKF